MTTARQLRFSYEDYLRALERSELKLEYAAGVILAMAGGTLVHAELAVAMSTWLRVRLPKGCSVFSSDARVRVEPSDFSAFPDVSAVCGERVSSPVDPNALVNPTLLVEVTSRSTEAYDRGEKLQHYQQLPSLKVVLLVSHRERRVTVVERTSAGWTFREIGAGERVELSALPLELDIDELYAGIALEP